MVAATSFVSGSPDSIYSPTLTVLAAMFVQPTAQICTQSLVEPRSIPEITAEHPCVGPRPAKLTIVGLDILRDSF
jgi:hypothetical protein